MIMVAQKKVNLVEKISSLLLQHNNFVLIKIEKTNHQTLEALRKELKKNQSLFKVIKNTLFARTVNKLSLLHQIFGEIKKTFLPLKETSALLLLDKDWSKGLHAFYEFVKKERSLLFKFGLLDGKSYKSEEILQIAQLPSKDQLMVNIIGSMKSPSSHLVYAMKFNLIKLVYMLKEKAKRG